MKYSSYWVKDILAQKQKNRSIFNKFIKKEMTIKLKKVKIYLYIVFYIVVGGNYGSRA